MGEQRDISLDKVDDLIKSKLKGLKKPLSTYEIAKNANLSWATANTHCYKLKSFGVIDGKYEEARIGIKRVVWWLTE